MLDYHIHSNFSLDSELKMEDACYKAIELGLKEIAFTDHIDLDWPGKEYTFEINLNQYFKSLSKIKKEFDHRILVKKGIELGIQPNTIEKTNKLIKGYEFDYIIASIHCVGGCDIMKENFFEDKTTFQAYLRYFEEVVLIVNSFKSFCCLGHLDLIRRYIPDKSSRNISYNDFSDIVDSILKILIDKHKGIEVNTSGLKYGLNSFLPGSDFIKRYRELGGEIITIGSDSHDTGRVGDKVSEAIELIKEAGFKYITGFNKMEPYFIKI